ncbi:MAG: DUF2341 domain-containing protein [Balneolaceae bacterium]|nr:DUF2341 domain-containing protein [Balneolaceae bacterium]
MIRQFGNRIFRLKGFKAILVGMCVALLCAVTSVAQPAGYLFYKPITLNGSQIQGTHSNFPVLINITDPDLAANARSDGFDIVFTSSSSSTTILDHEVESYNSSTGQLRVWVKVPSLPDAGTTIYMFYGNSGINSSQSTPNTWSNQFRLVNHMGNSLNDASPNTKNGTNFGSLVTTGKIGNARNFDGLDDYIAIDDFYNTTGIQQTTVSAWIKTSDGGNQIIASYDRNEYWRLEINGNGGGTGQIGWDLLTSAAQIDFGSSSTVNNNAWRYISAVYNNGNVRIYIDGVQNTSTTSGSSFGTGNTRYGYVGVGSESTVFNGNKGPSNYFNGDIDEFKISNVARSANWIATEYNNQNAPNTFHTLGNQTALDQTPPSIENIVATADSVILNYDEALGLGSIPSVSAFTVNVNGSPVSKSSVSISNDSVFVILTNPISGSDNITLSYNAGQNPIRDLSLNNAADFVNQAVTNLSAGSLPSPPIDITVIPIIGGDILITFLDVNGTPPITGYTIYRSTTPGGPYSQITTVNDNNSPSYSYTDANTVDGTEYFYVLSSTNSSSTQSSYSEESSATSDASNPILELITVSSGVVTLDYDELLDNGSIPAPSDFDVKLNSSSITVDNVDVSGSRVILEITPEASAGDNLTVDYVVGTNPIQDEAGNPASAFTNSTASNNTPGSGNYGPNPCPIVNSKDVAWACFSGVFNGTSLTANVGGLDIATITAASGSATTFAPNAIQQWSSGAFSGDQFNGPQANPSGTAGDATSLDINIPSTIPSDAIVLSLNRLRPVTGAGTSYTLEAFDGNNTKLTTNDWLTGQGLDGGVCTNNVVLNYTNGNTTIEFQPTISGNQSCASSSNPIWFRITDDNVERIELRKVATGADNIHIGLGVVADFGDADVTYGTSYDGSGTPPAFHLLNNLAPNTVYLGAVVDGDGNGIPTANNTGDDTESSSIGGGDDEDAISQLIDINTAQTSYQTTLVCTDGGFVSGWIDFNQNGVFDANEFANTVCSSGSATLKWTGISGLVTGSTAARFRIASDKSQVSTPIGAAYDGEVEDYTLEIIEPPMPDLEITKAVSNSNPVVGEAITYTVTLTNPGEYIASGVQVTDLLPSGVNFSSATPSQGTYNSSSGIWNIGTLAAGDTTTVTLTINATVNSGETGNTIINSASITKLNETDPELNNNSASVGITVVPESADIAVSKIVDDSTPIEGQSITFTIIATNNGPKSATNLNIIDQIPSGLLYVSSNPSVGSYNSSTGIWTIGTLANGAQATLVLNVQVDGGTQGNFITNSADVNSVDQNDPTPGNNTASAQIEVIPAGFPASCSEVSSLDFSNFSLLSGSAGQVGAIYQYTSVAPGVNAQIEIVTKFNATLTNFDQSSSGTAQNFQPQIEAVDKNQPEGYFDFEVRFIDSASSNPKYLTYTASAVDVDGDNQETREFVGFQRLTSFTVEGSTNLAVGSSGIYTTFESATPQVINGIDPTATSNIAYTTYTNEPQFRIRAGVKDPTNVNGASAQRLFSINFDPCIIESFNNPQETDIVEIGVTKSVNQNNVEVGDTLTYTITASNNQGNAVSNIELTDQIPTGLTLVSATASQGTYTQGSGVWDIGALVGFQNVNLVIKARINAGQEGNTITNTANITGFSGTDGNLNNNTASVDIYVDDPQSTSCNELPLFDFRNPMLEQGVPLQVNSIYRFSNITSGLDALVKVKAISNATLDDIDNGALANSQANFSPFFTATAANGYIDFEIKYVQAGTNTPVKRNFALTGLDIDGWNAGSGQTIKDYLGFAQNQSNTVQSGNNLIEATSGPFQTFESSTTTDGSGSFDINHMAYIVYNYTSVYEIRIGSRTTNGYSDDRLVDIDFTQCRNQDFTNPVVTTRDADIQVVKTVDEDNPLEGETINFTISVTNNGPENATEVDINEALPAGLTLVQSTPSKGTYNQLNKVWAIGSLNNGSTATLQIEATVNSNIQADSLINKAFVQGLNQVDPTIANDTSAVVIKVGVKLTGIVFQDITGNGFSEDLTFNDAAGDQQALENVEVHLFKDGGDGIADGTDDTFIETTTTNNLGEYTFRIGDDADYWVVVDSKTGELTDGSSWGEQTYGPIGGYCEDGTGNVAVKTAAGHCFGGRRGAQSDNISETPVTTDLPNAEHLAKVTISGSSVNSINFGFSFNVVTNTDDGDDDGTSPRSVQGSLRQFITNANQITGANTMRFVPSVPTNSSGSGGNWWTTTLTSELPAIVDPLTTIAGTAYLNTTPKTSRDDNPGTVGQGGSVGVDNLAGMTTTRKEFEVNLADAGNNALLVNSTGAYTIRNIALYNNATGIRVQAGNNGLLEKNIIGARADGTDPTNNLRLDNGIKFDGPSSINPLIQENYIAFTNSSAIFSSNQSSVLNVFKNEIYKAAQAGSNTNGIEGIGTWTIQQNRIHEVGNNSSSAINGGHGIEIGSESGTSSNNTIRNNSIYSNAVTGVSVLNGVTATVIERNLIYQNGTNYSASGTKLGAGIKLATPAGVTQSGVRIGRNSFYDNDGVAIDLVTSGTGEADNVNPNDGVLVSATQTPNRGLDYPVFTITTLENGVLHVEGYVGTSSTKLTGTYTIQVYKADDDGDSDALIEVGGSLTRPHGEGKDLIGVITTSADGTFNTDITVPGNVSLAFNDRVTAIAISSVNNTSEFSANSRVIPTGVSVSGYVYNDANHNMNKDGNEVGLENVTVVLYNTQQNNCKSVLTNASGFYEFTNVLNGTYDLIEANGQSVPTPDVCTPAANDPDDFISTTPNLRTVTVNNLPAIQDFGDFEGSKISGTVFNDNGITGGTANDGIKNGGEGGLSTKLVQALDGNDVLIEQTTSAADGTYNLYVPKSVVGTGGTIKIKETDGAEFITTGGSVGTTGGTYTIGDDQTVFINTTGTEYTGVDFGDVQISTLITDGSKSTQPGAVAIFTHEFTAQTAGTVTFTTSSVNNPNINFPVVLTRDLNCNGDPDQGEPILSGSDNISVTAGQVICLVLRVNVPNGVNDGATSTTTITATFDYANSATNIQQVLTRTDIVTVSTTDGGLVIIKAVDKSQALPGDTLTYTIDYENLGDEPISQVEVVDEVPAYTSYFSSSCGTLPSGFTNCTIDAPSVGVRGAIRWTFTGVLNPGETGSVSYKVLIDN